MCNFFSFLAMRDGSIKWNAYTDHHSDLVRHFKLIDDDQFIERFAKCEFKPDDNADLCDIEKYKLHVDEPTEPDWFEEVRDRVFRTAKRIVSQRILVDGEHDLLLGDFWILGGTVRVNAVQVARIIVMLESSKVGVMLESSKVGEMWESSNVGEMLGSSKVPDSKRVNSDCRVGRKGIANG